MFPAADAVAEISLVGTSASRAIFLIDGATRSFRSGQAVAPGLKLLEIKNGRASVDHNGKRIVLRVGDRVPGGAVDQQSVSLQADPQGHFLVTGTVNGLAVRFLVDTGATFVSLGASDARRLGVDMTDGETGYAATAAGNVPVTRVRLEKVSVGDIEISGVDALVHGNDLPVALLGMSFLNRTDMSREGGTMTLKRRY